VTVTEGLPTALAVPRIAPVSKPTYVSSSVCGPDTAPGTQPDTNVCSFVPVSTSCVNCLLPSPLVSSSSLCCLRTLPLS
jgi:hypothetical protein